MKIDAPTSNDVKTPRGGESPSHIGFTSGVLPEVRTPVATDLPTGVSTKNVLPDTSKTNQDTHWFTLRCAYGQESKINEHLKEAGVTTFYPTLTTVKRINGKRREVEESRAPNLLFAYGTFDELKTYVYDNDTFKHLRFYYRHYHVGSRIEQEPLIIPDDQMNSFKLICEAKEPDIIIIPETIRKFQKGELVRVIAGPFEGVIGTVARYQGQQRVGIVVDGLLTAITAYVPSGCLEFLEEK